MSTNNDNIELGSNDEIATWVKHADRVLDSYNREAGNMRTELRALKHDLAQLRTLIIDMQNHIRKLEIVTFDDGK